MGWLCTSGLSFAANVLYMAFQNQIHPKVIRQVILLLVIFVLGALLYRELHFMLGGFLGALALYMLLRMPMFYLAYTLHWKKSLSALLLLLLSLIVIVMPLTWVVIVLVQALKPLLADTTKLQQGLSSIDTFLHNRYDIDLLSNELMQKVPGIVAKVGGNLVGATLAALTNLIVMYFLLYFMLVKGGEMERWVRSNLPLKHTNTIKLIKEVREVVISNTIGIPVLGAIQGLVAMVGYMMFGVESPVMWGIITGIASVIPFVGTMAAWVPLTILTFAKGDSSNGYWLLFWGLVVIGSSDNVFRFILQKYIADIHPIITVFGVIIGLNLFGFLGLIFGPLLISLFLMLVRIYYDEYVTAHHEEEANARAK
jgi:predicted PurR-regulated permease PerM